MSWIGLFGAATTTKNIPTENKVKNTNQNKENNLKPPEHGSTESSSSHIIAGKVFFLMHFWSNKTWIYGSWLPLSCLFEKVGKSLE